MEDGHCDETLNNPGYGYVGAIATNAHHGRLKFCARRQRVPLRGPHVFGYYSCNRVPRLCLKLATGERWRMQPREHNAECGYDDGDC